jgi:hypothetical protein
MAVNTIRPEAGVQKEEKKKIFGGINNSLKMDKIFEEGVPVKYLPYALFIAGLLIFYIGNSHYAERTIRQTDKIKIEVEDLRADYTTLKAELMFASKQSEVAKKVAPYGLEESYKPPYKIVVKKGEY